MQPRILKLPETVINQIAAGEVVENPASIVKELIENSLDAGATQIDVQVIGGGHDLIKVEDNGCGMGTEDALLCLERHATSKIQSVEDLERLSTMGFRGEALAAIASVSRFELKTSNGKGTRVLAEGGKVLKVEPCARNLGTTIEVRSLFYNVPARKKFQKAASPSLAFITRTFETIALAHPQIAFSLNGKSFAATSQKERILEILGEYEHEVAGKGIFGYVASPDKAMSMRTGQYLYINKRPIFSPLLAKAVKEAFGTRIAEHAYPRFVLFLEVAPEKMDVNVHPQKKEVRFRDEGILFRAVQKTVEKAFTPQVSFDRELVFTAPPPTSFAETFPSLSFKVEEKELDWILPERALAVVGRFLLLQNEGLLLVDLKAVYARVLFDSLRMEKGPPQALLFPLEIPILPEEEARIPEIESLGIECRILKKTLVIDALPPFLEASEFPQFYKEWKGNKKLEDLTTRFCRSLRKNFSIEQAIGLWKEVQKCKDRSYDPLGNPLFVQIKEEDLARLL